jgi:transcription elongation GreA/GreB family factor
MGQADRRAAVARDLRWVRARLASAIVVRAADGPRDEVRFGARVTVADEDGVARSFTIVGEDEADAGADRVSWVSPLARAVAGARVGDEVTWRRPAGDRVLTVVRIEVPGDDGTAP